MGLLPLKLLPLKLLLLKLSLLKLLLLELLLEDLLLEDLLLPNAVVAGDALFPDVTKHFDEEALVVGVVAGSVAARLQSECRVAAREGVFLPVAHGNN